MKPQTFKRFLAKTVLSTVIYVAGAASAEAVVIQTTDVDPEESILPDVASVAGGTTAYYFLTPYTDRLVDKIADKREECKIEKAAAEAALTN